jgi:hypothetical protein|nr:MAG TPA: hypothetical protein [Bacteriophage sp.]
MGVKIGKQSVEGGFDLYSGVGAVNVIAVNPNKEELVALGRNVEEEPEYTFKNEDGSELQRVTFYVRTDPESKVNNGIDVTVPISFALGKSIRVGATSGKVQVIDKYGRTAWVTKEQYEAKEIPVYSNGPANIDKDYRAAYVGEEALVDFLIQWLNVPGPASYKDGKWIMKEADKLVDCEVSLNMTALLAGNVKELKDLIALAHGYAVKAAFGVRTTDEGKQYQAVFTRMFAKNAVTNYSKLDEAIKDAQANGAAPNTEFSVKPLHKYVVESTDFSAEEPTPTASTPWDWSKPAEASAF